MNELDHFRDEVQTFLAEHLTAELQRAGRLEAGIYAERPVAEAWLKYSIRRAGRFPLGLPSGAGPIGQRNNTPFGNRN